MNTISSNKEKSIDYNVNHEKQNNLQSESDKCKMIRDEKQLLETDDAECTNNRDDMNLTKITTDEEKGSEILTSISSKENVSGSSDVSSLSNSHDTLNGPIINKSVNEIVNDDLKFMLNEIIKNGNIVKNLGKSDKAEETKNSSSSNRIPIPSYNEASCESNSILPRNSESSNESCDSIQNHIRSENNTGKRKREELEENREIKVAKTDNEITSLDVRKRKREAVDEDKETKVLKTDNIGKVSVEKCNSSKNDNEKEDLIISRTNALPSVKNVEKTSEENNQEMSSDKKVDVENTSEENNQEMSSDKKVDVEKTSEENNQEMSSDKKVDAEHVEDQVEGERIILASNRETLAKHEKSEGNSCVTMKENCEDELHDNKTKNLDECQKECDKTAKKSKEDMSNEKRVVSLKEHTKESKKETQVDDIEDSNSETTDKIEESHQKKTSEEEIIKVKEHTEESKKETRVDDDVEDSNSEIIDKTEKPHQNETNEKTIMKDNNEGETHDESKEKTKESTEEMHAERVNSPKEHVEDPQESEKETQQEDVKDSINESIEEESHGKTCEKETINENNEVSYNEKGKTQDEHTNIDESEGKTKIISESISETVSKFDKSKDVTPKKFNKEAEQISYKSKGEACNEESKENIQGEDNAEATDKNNEKSLNLTLEGSEDTFCSDKFSEEKKELEKSKSEAHVEHKQTSLKSKEDKKINEEVNKDDNVEIKDIDSHKMRENSENETSEASDISGDGMDIERSFADEEKENELDEDHTENTEEVLHKANDDILENAESPSKAMEFEGFESKSIEDVGATDINDDKDDTELNNIIIGEAFTINEEQMIEMDNSSAGEHIQPINQSPVSAKVKATSIRRSVKDGKKKPSGKASRKYKKITFKTKKKKKYAFPSTSSAAQYIPPIRTELNLPLFLEELASIDPKLIVIRDRYNEDGKKFKVHCITFHETVLDWAMSETLISSLENSKTLRKKLKLKMNGCSMFPENLEPKIGDTHPVSIGDAFPFAMPRIGVRSKTDTAEEVRLPFPLEQLCDLCPSASGFRDTEVIKPRRLNSVVFADEPLEWAFKETFLSSFEDSPILSDLLGLTSSTTKWPDVTEEILSNEGVDYSFPFACPNSGKRMYESLLFSNLTTDLPSSLLHETLQLPPLPADIEKNLYGERDALVRLLAIASFYKHSSCIPTIKSNRKLSSIHSALIESFRPLIISQANKLAIIIRKARERLLKGVTCQDISIIPALIEGPINSKRGNLFSHLQKLEAAVAKDPNNKLQNI